MATDFIIRQALPSDGQSVSSIYAPYVERTPISFEEKAPDAAEMSRRISTTLLRCPYLVAESDGRVIGYAYASPHHERASYRWSVNVAVYLDETVRRQGIGRTLYGVLFPLLKQQGFVMAYAGVTLPNAASVGLHEAMGFKQIVTYRNVGFKMGRWHDVGWWDLPLIEPPAHPAEPIPWPAMPPLEPVRRTTA